MYRLNLNRRLMKPFNVAIIDDHLLFAEGIGRMIDELTYCKLAWIDSNTKNLVEKIESNQVHLLVLDINISPNENGIEIVNRLKKTHPFLKIMLLSMYQPIDIGLNLTQFIGEGYVLKTSGKTILENALEQILIREQTYIDPNVQNTPSIRDQFTNNLRLTRREKEIIELLAQGKKNKEIATELFLSEHTVKTHRKNIAEKLGTDGLNELVYKFNKHQ
jgi:DNA-binding NarL/FixJ family response regulator